MIAPAFLDAAGVAAALPPRAAVEALGAALRAGLDVDADPPRAGIPAGSGELLIMASTTAGVVGVKLATVAPGNPARRLPRIQGVYVLFDADTLTPVALLDAAALTEVRTAAVSALAVRHAAPEGAARLLVFGTGPQARAHVAALRAERTITHVDVAGRDPRNAAAFAASLRAEGLSAAALPGAVEGTARSSGGAAGAARPSGGAVALRRAVAAADLICCCTTARSPLFAGRDVAAHATVVAVGSHEPDARELDAALLGRSVVVVESRATALREAGDVILAVAEGALAPDDLVGLAALVRGEAVRPPGRPLVVKSVGMAWEDAVLAAAAVRARPGQ